MKPLVFASCLLAGAGMASAQQVSLMPLPMSAQRADGSLTITPAQGESSFTLRYGQTHDARLEAAAMRMVDQLDRTCGGEVRRSVLQAQPDAAQATLEIDVAGPGEPVQGIDEVESYTLKVTPTGATLTAPTDVGAIHGMQTFLQLASHANGACVIPAFNIEDAPRFAWRGFMIDVSRHFETVPQIERTLDGMAMAKLNVFHWHLSDDQGFRAESRKFPKLTELASNGQFYTQDQMRAVVAYARARGIRVVPEFDMPGHTSSWILAYPELGSGTTPLKALPIVYGTPEAELDPTRESTYKFVDALVGEMGEIFPDAYFHIGGDEVQGKDWQTNPKIQAFMQKHGFQNKEQLQAYFNQRLLVILKKHHKRMLGWDEILQPTLPKDIVIQSWRGNASLAAGARQGYQGILSAPYYLDGQKTSAQMFLDDPIPADTTLDAAQQKLILGGEVCMWAEQLDVETADSRIWPRTMAVAERFWSPQSDRDVSFMYQRLRKASLQLEDVGLTHITGPQKLRRNLVGEYDPAALDLLASVTEPISFGERYQGQHTNGYTSLDRLVDAVVADPPSRQEIAGEVDALVGKMKVAQLPANRQNTAGDVPQGFLPAKGVAEASLRQRFLTWQRESPAMFALSHATPRLNDVGPLALELGQMGAIGMQALTFLDTGTPAPADWTMQAQATLETAQKGGALVRFTFLPSLRKLVEAASQISTQ